MSEQIETWNTIVRRAFGDGTRILFPRFFPSKKNQVTLLELERGGEKFEVLAKFFVWGNPEIEWETASSAGEAGIPVPGLIRKIDNVIFMEFVPGKTLIAMAEEDPGAFDAKPLARWLGKFHKAFASEDGLTTLKGDVMLPNFIISEKDGRIYGLDFEESKKGRPIFEIANLAATIISSGKLWQAPAVEGIRIFIEAYLEENKIRIDAEELRALIIESLKSRIQFMPRREALFKQVISGIRKEEPESFGIAAQNTQGDVKKG